VKARRKSSSEEVMVMTNELNATEWLINRAIKEMLEGHAEHFPNQGVDVYVQVVSENQKFGEGSQYRLGMSLETLKKQYGKEKAS
jgi:hypothetical protein